MHQLQESRKKDDSPRLTLLYQHEVIVFVVHHNPPVGHQSCGHTKAIETDGSERNAYVSNNRNDGERESQILNFCGDHSSSSS